MPCVILSENIPKKRRCSLPALYGKHQGWDGCVERQSKKLITTQKLKIKEDVYLSDHTVAKDDPRIMKSLEAINRIRKRTDFDPQLLKDKCWAAKVCKDLSFGLAKIDKTEMERKRIELGCVRNLEAEKLNLTRRLEKMINSSDKPVQTQRRRSKSVDYTANKSLEMAYQKMSTSAKKLSHYCSQLEAQGGFITQILENDEEQEILKDDVTFYSLEQKGDLEKEDAKLPEIHKHDLHDLQFQQTREECISVHCQRRASSHSEGSYSFSVRSSSLPFIENDQSCKLQNKFNRSSLSVPDRLNLMI